MVFRPPKVASWPVLALKLLHLNVGLVIYGFAVALMVVARVGLGPWDVFHQGIELNTPLTFGQAMIAAGMAILLYSILGPKVKVGIGTILNMLLIGVWSDVFLALPWLSEQSFGFGAGLALFIVGLVLCGLATGLYITAGLGAGPRDGFVIGVSRMTGGSVRLIRTLTEITVLALGWLMGGSVGVGTVLFALTVGPLMQFFLRLFRGFEPRYAAMNARVTAGGNRSGT